MSKMCNIIASPVGDTGKQFDRSVNNHKVFCFDWDDEVYINQAVWKKHAIGKEQTHDSSGCSDDYRSIQDISLQVMHVVNTQPHGAIVIGPDHSAKALGKFIVVIGQVWRRKSLECIRIEHHL